MRFDDRVTGTLSTYAQNAQVIHVDIDPAEIGKNVMADIGIVGDVKQVLRQLLPSIEHRQRSQWFAQIEEWQQESATRDILTAGDDETLHVPYVIDQIRRQPQRQPGDDRQRRGPASDVGGPVLPARAAQPVPHLGRAGLDGLRRAGGDRRQLRQARRRGVGRSSATAASR